MNATRDLPLRGRAGRTCRRSWRWRSPPRTSQEGVRAFRENRPPRWHCRLAGPLTAASERRQALAPPYLV